MSNAKPRWMPLDWGDYFKDTLHLTTAAAHGAYLLLISAYWVRGGPLPDDDAYLSAIAHLDARAWKKLRPTLAAFFQVNEGKWHHRRIDHELAIAAQIYEARRVAGQHGGIASAAAKAKRTSSRAVAVAQANVDPGSSPAAANVEPTSSAAPANVKQNPTHIQVQEQSKEGRKKQKGSEPKGSGRKRPDLIDPENDLGVLAYQLVGRLLGAKSGGIVTKLHATRTWDEVVAILREAEGKLDPAAWIGAVLREDRERPVLDEAFYRGVQTG